MQLSKSDYMMFLRHPAWLWLKKHEPKKLPAVDAGLQAMFDTGHAFEPYAESLFEGGVTLGFNDYPSYKSLPERTTKALADGAKTIFQGRFEFEDLTFICDVIQVVNGNEIDLIEIKSSTGASKDHELDLAFQLYVLEGCGFSVRNITVMHVNNQYERRGEVVAAELVATTDVTEAVKARREETSKQVEAAVTTAQLKECPDLSPSLAKNGSFPDWIKVFKAVNNTPLYSIYDLAGIGAKNIGLLEEMGIKNIVDIPEDFKLSTKQALQVQATKQGAPIIDVAPIRAFLSELEFPLYFFDYETMSSLVPYFDGLRPYQQVPFQYSLHVLDSPDDEVRHMEYLHDENTNPAESLSKTLQSQIGDKGSVIAWNMGFEKGCNTALGKLAPTYADFYEKLNERIVDLMIPFSNSWYVDKDFMGSASIKYVLPVLVPELSYKELTIQEGGTAQRTWMDTILDGKNPEDKDQILSNLRQYCTLDTLAMVEIYRKLSAL